MLLRLTWKFLSRRCSRRVRAVNLETPGGTTRTRPKSSPTRPNNQSRHRLQRRRANASDSLGSSTQTSRPQVCNRLHGNCDAWWSRGGSNRRRQKSQKTCIFGSHRPPLWTTYVYQQSAAESRIRVGRKAKSGRTPAARPCQLLTRNGHVAIRTRQPAPNRQHLFGLRRRAAHCSFCTRVVFRIVASLSMPAAPLRSTASERLS